MDEQRITKEELDKAFYEINEELGFALRNLVSRKRGVGREQEKRDLAIILNRKDTPVAALIAPAGSGKTQIVTDLMLDYEERGKFVQILELKIGMLAGEGPQVLTKRMNILLDKLKIYKEKVLQYNPAAELILFIDEVHTVVTVFGPGSKLGGDLLKDSLSRAEEFVKVIAATTNDEFDRYIASDKPLARRFKKIALQELGAEDTFKVLRGWLASKSTEDNDLNAKISDDVLEYIINANSIYRPDEHEPAKSIDTVATIEAMHSYDNVPMDKALVFRAFRVQYGVELDFKTSAEHIRNVVSSRVIGQPMALHAIEGMSRRLAASTRIKDTHKPRYRAMFFGTTGTGKTETVKALAEAVYKTEDAIINISMTDYSEPDSGMRFRRTLGMQIKNRPASIVLLDELEKAHGSILNILLPVLDEGKMKYFDKSADGYEVEFEVSFGNSIIIATSNAGAKTIKEIDAYSNVTVQGTEVTLEMEENARKIEDIIVKALDSTNLKPEFLGRFETIVSFASLSDETYRIIAKKSLFKMLRTIKDAFGVTVKMPPDENWAHAGFVEEGQPVIADKITMFVVHDRINTSDPNQSGGRAIKKVIDRDVQDVILRAMEEHPNVTKFNMTTNGMSQFERPSAASSRGAIVLIPKG